MNVYNGDFNGDYFHINSLTVSVTNNHNLIGFTKKIDKFSTNRYLSENNVLPDGVGIDDMSLVSTLNQYFNM